MQQQGMTAGAIIKESYQLARKLGEGGMGEVWEAFNPRLPKMKYAIKFLFGHSTSSEQCERFQREAKILTALDHENITRIHDLDFNYQPPFIVLEYLDGEPLSSRLARAREYGQVGLPLTEVVHILRQVGAALKVTHSRGVIHRDLKPDNIYLCNQAGAQIPLIKVLDFGVSKMSGEQQITQHQQGFLGTPQYMSPEQALGYENLDHRADQFALGIILYELLSGELPFKGEQIIQIATQIVHGDPPYIREHLPTLSDEAAQALHRALCKSPDDRFASCEDFVEAFLYGTSVIADDDDWSAENKTEIGVRDSIVSGGISQVYQPAEGAAPESWDDSQTLQIRYHPESFHTPPPESVSANSGVIQSADPSTFPKMHLSREHAEAIFKDHKTTTGNRRGFLMVIIAAVLCALVLGVYTSQPPAFDEYARDVLSDLKSPSREIKEVAAGEITRLSIINSKSFSKLKKKSKFPAKRLSLRSLKVKRSGSQIHLVVQMKRDRAGERKIDASKLQVLWMSKEHQRLSQLAPLPLRSSRAYEVFHNRFTFKRQHQGRWVAVIIHANEVIAHLTFEVTS